ncbi:MAG: LytTR family DNA-binding domain-containing protein [Oscillospiraceae bacterium]|nr:LytTR family DNA-binding domain-containing protein [Oscillospiraceae bacterium]
MKIKIALCDDDAKALPVIAGAAESAFQEKGIYTDIRRFNSGRALLQAMEQTRFHIVLLDIEMPGMDGIAVGKRLRELGDGTHIVYVSEAESRVFESFLVQPLGFVRKSNFLNDIAAVVELYVKTCSQDERGDYLEFQTRSGLLTLKSRQIRYIEGSRNYQLLYLEGQKEPTEVKMTMDKLEEATRTHSFIRIHKGYLVNYRCIQRISASAVTLLDGTQLPIGRSKAAEVKSKYLSILGES